ncbi:hypothetical protein ODZ84_03830 [Chryseobacterium fluminis]|uniref:hypothetical protein n=1 Tax=Chryseobacterium fluminis TaxID=2983606 RepID=UPI00224DCEC7|nr:hypothetical protein [Chryseobacterium sp. MMS21-Ot14]UZT98713.1 hypothetical protein ODZ84_03830 [Chryseobacterium sp. MMS21-Ot14]
MKNQNLFHGKKLYKKQLCSISGGLYDCMEAVLCTDPPCDPAPVCTKIHPACAQKQCRP